LRAGPSSRSPVLVGVAPADRGLTEPQLAGGAADAARLGHGEEDAEVVPGDIH
jgi:hypothetical protein